MFEKRTCFDIYSCVPFQFALLVGIAFLAEVIGAVLVFVFKDEIVKQVQKELSVEGIVRYRDDPDFHDLVNWAQEEVAYSISCPISEH